MTAKSLIYWRTGSYPRIRTRCRPSGEKYGITKERVRQLEERLKKKIRTYIEEQIPDLP